MDQATSAFGEKMKEQVEERLRFYEDGVAPRKNIDMMGEALAKVKEQLGAEGKEAAPSGKKEKKKDKKRAAEEVVVAEEEAPKKEKKVCVGGRSILMGGTAVLMGDSVDFAILINSGHARFPHWLPTD